MNHIPSFLLGNPMKNERTLRVFLDLEPGKTIRFTTDYSFDLSELMDLIKKKRKELGTGGTVLIEKTGKNSVEAKCYVATCTGTIKIETECECCSGAGVFLDTANEGAGIGAVCYVCGGTGKKMLSYVPFTGRKTREDIMKVHRLNTGHRPIDSDFITYTEFCEGKMPVSM